MTPPTPGDVERLLRTLTRVLCAVGLLALIFTTTNVTRFAASRDVPLPIATLLDPMLALTLAGILYADARLASWNIPPPGWSRALRWWAGTATAAMNTWNSLWPDGNIGLPHHADPAAVLLHLIPCLLLIGLAETIAAYRTLLTQVHPRTPPAPHSAVPAQPPHPGPDDDQPTDAPREPIADAELFARARLLDATARERTGRPVSIRALRRHLHLGQPRAQQLRARLDALHPTGTSAPQPAPAPDSPGALDQER